MYDIKRAIRKLHPLIKRMARKNAISVNFKMSKDDLEGEGMFILLRCCEKFQSGNFEHYFAKAFKNRINKLRVYGNRPMRKGIEIPIDCLEEVGNGRSGNFKFQYYNIAPAKIKDNMMLDEGHVSRSIHKDTIGFNQAQKFFRTNREKDALEGLKDRAKRLLPLLSSEAVRLLLMTTDPLHMAEVEEQAYHEYLRRRHLGALGIRCPGQNQCHISKRHFRKALGMTRKELQSTIREIQSVDSILQKGGKRWPRK